MSLLILFGFSAQQPLSGEIAPEKAPGSESNVLTLDHAGSAPPPIHWAYQPLSNPAPPPVQDQSWPRHPIDQFILAQLEKQELRPAPDSDPYAWLRRVTLDLTGLPPAAEEITAFIEDASPLARERVVDRLLASPRFGERWARHWLDLVGYADQIGTVNDVPAAHAWRYRDYVVRAFNSDKPFDRFIQEQVAGDLLPETEPEIRQDSITATGFLLLGEIHIVTADKTQLRADIVDHQIQKIGAAFLGQTLGCVRCHDHKFDPIHLEDYYGLAGIFNSTESSYVTERGVWSSLLAHELPETDEQRLERQRALLQHQAVVQRIQAERTDLSNQLAAVTLQLQPPTNSPPRSASALPLPDASACAEPATSTQLAAAAAIEAKIKVEPEPKPAAPDPQALKTELTKKIASLDTRLLHLAYIEPKAAYAYSVRDAAEPGDGRIHIRGNARAPGKQIPRGFVRILGPAPWPAIPAGASGRLELAKWLSSPRNPLPARVNVNRVWQKLFGEGLVRSVDYFGTRGEPPTHPELLDWLAQEFIRGGWSAKHLIRAITLSRAYGLGSAPQPPSELRDPENRSLSRMNRRRLDAESIRDAVLAVSGQLLFTPGGPALALHLPENVGGLDPKDVNPVSFRTSIFPAEQHHLRTLYLPVVRSRAQPGPAELRNLFDFVPPTEMTGQRPATSVATQALFLLNSEFMKSNAAKLAGWVLNQPPPASPESSLLGPRLSALYLLALNRPITADEIASAAAFLNISSQPSAEEERAVWAAFCHALLSSNEFLFRL